jgi:hypothetical protein
VSEIGQISDYLPGQTDRRHRGESLSSEKVVDRDRIEPSHFPQLNPKLKNNTDTLNLIYAA